MWFHLSLVYDNEIGGNMEVFYDWKKELESEWRACCVCAEVGGVWAMPWC